MHGKEQRRDEGDYVSAWLVRQDFAQDQKQEHGYACMQQQIQKVIAEWPVAIQFVVHRESCEGYRAKNGANSVWLEKLFKGRPRDLGVSEDVQLVVHREAIEE